MIVGRVEFAKLKINDLLTWVNKYWVLKVGYTPRVYMLISGWIYFIFMDEYKIENLLNNVCLYNEGYLLLKRWHLSFNFAREKQTRRHLWMLLPGFPLEL